MLFLDNCYRIYAIASQLSPVDQSSGIEHLEAETFSLYCFQTLTGTYIEMLDFMLSRDG